MSFKVHLATLTLKFLLEVGRHPHSGFEVELELALKVTQDAQLASWLVLATQLGGDDLIEVSLEMLNLKIPQHLKDARKTGSGYSAFYDWFTRTVEGLDLPELGQ